MTSCLKVLFRVSSEADNLVRKDGQLWDLCYYCPVPLPSDNQSDSWHSQERSCRRELGRWGTDYSLRALLGKPNMLSACLKLCFSTICVFDPRHVILSLWALVTIFLPNKDAPPTSQGHWNDQRRSDTGKHFVYHSVFTQWVNKLNCNVHY